MGLPRLESREHLRLEPTPKWVRALLDGKTVADSRNAMIVRPEKGPPRAYAFPPGDVDDAVPEDARLEVDGHIALQWEDMDHWYEESEEVFVHPRDPHKRIDALHSARHVRVELEGEVLADSRRPVVLIESFPMLPVRYYLPPDDLVARVRPSKNVTGCPYKGWAGHHHVQVGDRWVEDLAWSYLTPLREVEPIRGRYCFYNEKVDVFVDGEMEERPKSPFS